MASEITGISSSGTLYVRIKNSAAKWWNGSAFETYSSGNWATYAISMTQQGSSGIYIADFPTGITTQGTYEYFVYNQVDVSPAEGDIVVSTGKIDWTGNSVVTSSTGSMSGTEWLSYIVNNLGFKRTDKDDIVYAATTDAIQIMRRKFMFDEAEIDSTTTDTISVLGDFKLEIESNLGLLLNVILEDDDHGTELMKITKSEFDCIYPDINIDSHRGYPKHFCVYAGNIYIGPVPDRTSFTYRINYSLRGGTITSTTTGVPFTNLYRDVLGDLTMSRVYIALEDFEKASYWENRFMSSFNEATRRERLNSGNGFFKVRPFVI